MLVKKLVYPKWSYLTRLRPIVSQFFIALFVLYGLAMSNSALGEEIRFDTESQWRKWKLPNGTVEVTNDGFLKLLPVGRKIDAVKNARSFGGGIHAA